MSSENVTIDRATFGFELPFDIKSNVQDDKFRAFINETNKLINTNFEQKDVQNWANLGTAIHQFEYERVQTRTGEIENDDPVYAQLKAWIEGVAKACVSLDGVVVAIRQSDYKSLKGETGVIASRGRLAGERCEGCGSRDWKDCRTFSLMLDGEPWRVFKSAEQIRSIYENRHGENLNDEKVRELLELAMSVRFEMTCTCVSA